MCLKSGKSQRKSVNFVCQFFVRTLNEVSIMRNCCFSVEAASARRGFKLYIWEWLGIYLGQFTIIFTCPWEHITCEYTRAHLFSITSHIQYSEEPCHMNMSQEHVTGTCHTEPVHLLTSRHMSHTLEKCCITVTLLVEICRANEQIFISPLCHCTVSLERK